MLRKISTFRHDSIEDQAMSKVNKIISLILLVFTIVIFDECASSKKNPYFEKRKQQSRVNSSQLGRNRYFFSTGYQKKLNKNFKKR